MICSIHQPNYIPYLWLFHKINQSDVFVFYDTAQYTKWDYHNRNKIKWSNGEILLTIPVNIKLWDKINDVTFNNKILKKHLKTIDQSYKKSSYYNEVSPLIKDIFLLDENNLSKFNINFIRQISIYLWIKTKILVLSELDINLQSSWTDALIDICSYIECDEYISWSWWRSYIEESKFKDSWINLMYQTFSLISYTQQWWEFIPYMSIIDLLFNEWKDSIKYIS